MIPDRGRKIGTWLCLMLLLPWGQAAAQHFIGLQKDEIRTLMQKSFPGYRPDNSTVNTHYNYLKFVNPVTEQTMLFFMTEDQGCSYVRWISDYSNLSDMTGMLDRNYTRVDNSTWKYSQRGKQYLVTLEQQQWYFTVNIRGK